MAEIVGSREGKRGFLFLVSRLSSHSLAEARTRCTVWMHCVRERGGLCSLCWLCIRTGDAGIGAPAFGGLAPPAQGVRGSSRTPRSQPSSTQLQMMLGLGEPVSAHHSSGTMSSCSLETPASGGGPSRPPTRYNSRPVLAVPGMVTKTMLSDMLRKPATGPGAWREVDCPARVSSEGWISLLLGVGELGSAGKGQHGENDETVSWDPVSCRTHQGLWWLSQRSRRHHRPRRTSLTECVTTSVADGFETGLQPGDGSPGRASASGSSSLMESRTTGDPPRRSVPRKRWVLFVAETGPECERKKRPVGSSAPPPAPPSARAYDICWAAGFWAVSCLQQEHPSMARRDQS